MRRYTLSTTLCAQPNALSEHSLHEKLGILLTDSVVGGVELSVGFQ
jgi:hypothetical protein